ncbi:MAG: hypothetical protein EXS16_03675 [Gemmataceae bacterium]|nr:hypothetical protein [Gemmataceae bacterium]
MFVTKPPMLPRDVPALQADPDDRLFHFADCEGVIFRKGEGWESNHWYFSAWTPSREEIRSAEERLPTFLGELAKTCVEKYDAESAQLIAATLNTYLRQYFGIVIGEQQVVFINFFTRDFVENWMTEPVIVCDGGCNFFQVIYRPTQGDFQSFTVNGEA